MCLAHWLTQWLAGPATAFAANVAPDYPLVEKPIAQEIAVAPLIVEGTVIAPGSFQAVVEVEGVYKNALATGGRELPRCLRVTGFNSIAGDRSSRALRAGDRLILFLQPAGDLYFTPRVGGGRFVIEAATEYGEAKVVVSLGDPLLLVPLDPEHFRTLIRAVVARQALAAADDMPPEADRSAADKLRRAECQKQIDSGVALAKASLLSGNPARQYFGVVLARSLATLELAGELTTLSESNNARLQAESLEALATLIRRYGFAAARFDQAGLLRSARAGLRSTALRTRLAAALALEQMPADGVARDLMTFYRDGAAEYLALKSSDEKRGQFVDQRSRFWLSPALLKDPAGEAILLDFAASNDLNTATGALAVLGLRGSVTTLPGLVELLGEKDFKYADDAKVAIFRIALSDEILKSGGDWKAWAAAAEQWTPAERLQAGLQRVDHLLSRPGGAAGAADDYQRGLLLSSCLPGELSLPKMATQTAVPPGELAPVVFARTQSPLAFPYLAKALIAGDDNAQIQAEIALRGWAELEPLVACGCDSEIGLLAAEQTRYGDNPGLDAATDLRGPDVAWGVQAGIALDGATRYRGRRMQILQAYHGQSFGWGEYELEWNTTLWQWALLRGAEQSRGERPLPPATRDWLAGERERQAEARTADALTTWMAGLAAADPLAAREAWRRLAIAGLTLTPPIQATPAASQRAQVITAAWAATADDRPIQARLLAVNLLGQLRAPYDPRIAPLVANTTPLPLRQQAWYTLGRLRFSTAADNDTILPSLIQQATDLALNGSDPYERVLAAWALRSLPGADAALGGLLATNELSAALRQAAAAALLYRAANEPAAELPTTLAVIARSLPDGDDRVQRRLLAAVGACQAAAAPAVRTLRIEALAKTLDRATTDTYDLPANLLRVELNPQPYMPAHRYQLTAAEQKLLRAGLQKAWVAASEDPEVTLSDNADRGYGWAFATGAWPARDFNELQREAIDPLGRWPQRRARTAACALEGLARGDARVPVARLRALLQSDDDRLAGYAGLLLARQQLPEDLLPIFNRFNNATPKTATWFNVIGATGSTDGFKFLTDTMKTTGHEAWQATWALGFFDADGARARLTQTGTDARASNQTAAIFGWTRQLQLQPALATGLARGAAADQLLLCEAVEWLEPTAGQAPTVRQAIYSLLRAPDAAVRQRADLALTRLTGQAGWHGADTTPPTAAELVAHWEPILYPTAPK